jgi:hypothetical protein
MSLNSSITRKPRGYAPAHLANQESEPQGFAHVKYKRHPVYSRTEWLYETSTLTFNLGLLVGIIYIFIKMEDKPLSS